MMIARRIAFLALGYLAAVTLFMTWNARGSWDFLLWFRGQKLIGISLVAVAVSVATILFQTLTRNRILTPALMGFDALYILLQTALVFALGGSGYVQMTPELGFFISFVVMMAVSLALFGTLLGSSNSGSGQDLHRLLLTGIILGVFFRSITSFLSRVIDPNDFVVAATAGIARFSRVNTELLMISSAVMGLALVATWRMRHEFDVVALGREISINLGVHYKKRLYATLVIIASLVSVSTALVGPITFLGLLASNLTYQILPTHRHAILLPAAALLSGNVLIGGQVILEQMLAFSTPLSVVIEFLGGITFLILVIRASRQ